MPPLEQMDLNQKAMYWVFASVDSYGVQVVATPGIELNVRWNDKRGQTVDKDGNVVAYDAMVIADRALVVQSVMWLGAEASIPGSSGVPESNLLQVRIANLYKSLDGRNTRYEHYLVRFTDTLPTG